MSDVAHDPRALPATAAAVEVLLAERTAGLGLQLHVVHRGRVAADWAVGATVGGPMRTSHLHNVYCATKPLLALAIGRLLDARRLTLDAPLASLLAPGERLLPPWPVSLAEVLNHTAGLAKPSAMAWRMTPPARRHRLLDFAGGRAAAEYSELVGGLVLEAVVERAAGVPADEFVRVEVLGPLGLDDAIVLRPAVRLADVMPRVRVMFGGLPAEAIPMLSERIPSEVAEIRPAFGGLATMTGLGTLYAALGRVFAGEPVAGLPTPATLQALLARRRGAVQDPVLGRAVDFAGGFMRDLGGGGACAAIGASSFGHTAGFSGAIGFHDPRADLGLALYFNGVMLDAERLHGARRTVIAAVYQDLGVPAVGEGADG